MIRRLPLACTVPMPLLIATLFDPVTLQRRIADCPRSILRGSTEKSAITGFPGAVGPLFEDPAAGAGGGGGGIGVFLLQAEAIKTSPIVMLRAALREGRNWNE
jgi:hypothetical protein